MEKPRELWKKAVPISAIVLLALAWSCTTLASGSVSGDYARLVEDLANAKTIGYQSNFLAIPTQGAVLKTEEPLAVCVLGKGFFRLASADGDLYTRQGVLVVNAENQLCERTGIPLAGLPAFQDNFIGASIQISPLGVVRYDTVKEKGLVLGKIGLFELNDAHPRRVGAHFSGRFVPDTSEARLIQGFLETSNVDVDETVGRLYSAITPLGDHEFQARLKQIDLVAAYLAKAEDALPPPLRDYPVGADPFILRLLLR